MIGLNDIPSIAVIPAGNPKKERRDPTTGINKTFKAYSSII